jgi:hypothetical protein
MRGLPPPEGMAAWARGDGSGRIVTLVVRVAEPRAVRAVVVRVAVTALLGL